LKIQSLINFKDKSYLNLRQQLFFGASKGTTYHLLFDNFFLVFDDGASYVIFGYVFSYFLCIWRKISCNLEKLSMVWGTICIAFIRVVIIHFYPKPCNSIRFLSVFSKKSYKSAKQDITRSITYMKIEDQWFLEGCGRQYKMKKNSFQVPKYLKTEEQ